MSTLPWNWIIPIAMVILAILGSVGLHLLQQVRRSSGSKAQERPHPDATEQPRSRADAQAEAD